LEDAFLVAGIGITEVFAELRKLLKEERGLFDSKDLIMILQFIPSCGSARNAS
jgi:hypothetical protein